MDTMLKGRKWTLKKRRKRKKKRRKKVLLLVCIKQSMS
jgi:hypothetical protein